MRSVPQRVRIRARSAHQQKTDTMRFYNPYNHRRHLVVLAAALDIAAVTAIILLAVSNHRLSKENASLNAEIEALTY